MSNSDSEDIQIIDRVLAGDVDAFSGIIEKYKDKMNDSIALKISEHLPRTPSELRPFFAKERVTLDKEAADEILAVVKKYND